MSGGKAQKKSPNGYGSGSSYVTNIDDIGSSYITNIDDSGSSYVSNFDTFNELEFSISESEQGLLGLAEQIGATPYTPGFDPELGGTPYNPGFDPELGGTPYNPGYGEDQGNQFSISKTLSISQGLSISSSLDLAALLQDQEDLAKAKVAYEAYLAQQWREERAAQAEVSQSYSGPEMEVHEEVDENGHGYMVQTNQVELSVSATTKTPWYWHYTNDEALAWYRGNPVRLATKRNSLMGWEKAEDGSWKEAEEAPEAWQHPKPLEGFANEERDASFRMHDRALFEADADTPNAVMKGANTHYLDEQEQAAATVRMQDGKLVDAEGHAVDTRDASGLGTNMQSGEGRHIFAKDTEGTTRALDPWAHHKESQYDDWQQWRSEQDGEFAPFENLFDEKERPDNELQMSFINHSSLVAGGDVRSAGEMVVEDGEVKVVSDSSGHYRPDAGMHYDMVNGLVQDGAAPEGMAVNLLGKERGGGASHAKGGLFAGALEFLSYGGDLEAETQMRDARAARSPLMEAITGGEHALNAVETDDRSAPVLEAEGEFGPSAVYNDPNARATHTAQSSTKTVAPEHDTHRRTMREMSERVDRHNHKKPKTIKGRSKRKNAKDTLAVGKAEASRWAAELSQSSLDALDAAGFDQDPLKLNLLGRLKDGPGLSDTELRTIDVLTTEGEDMWLSYAGLFTTDQALAYLHEGKFYDWLRLEAETRVQLATIAFQRGIGAATRSPAFTLGRHFVIHGDDEFESLVAGVERDEDVRDSFVQTMLANDGNADAMDAIEDGAIGKKVHGIGGAIRKHTVGNKGKNDNVEKMVKENAQANKILERVFLVMQAGLQLYDKEVGDHVDYPASLDVCRALAHGGRVNIRIPSLANGSTGRELTDFMGITEDGKGAGGAVFTRGFGTHHMDIGKNTDEGRGHFIEDGEKGAAQRNGMSKVKKGAQHVHLWGMNVSAGGLGNLDHNGDVILPDGAHGHMFIALTQPTNDRDGALQIGMETTGPGASSMVGYVHDSNSSEATANPESSFGGHKSDKVGDGSPRKVDLKGAKSKSGDLDSWQSTNARYIDLQSINGGDWEAYLEDMKTEFEDAKSEDAQGALNQLVGAKGAFQH